MTLGTSPPVTGPAGLPLFGSLFAFRSDPIGFLTSAAREHGDITRFQVGTEEIWGLFHPDRVEELLVGHKDVLVKGIRTAALSSVVGNGLLTSEGETWRTQRKRVAPSFQPRHLAAYGQAMTEVTRKHLPAPGTLDVHALMTQITLDIVVRTLFGTALTGERSADRVGVVLTELMEDFEHEFRTAWRLLPSWLPAPHRSRARRRTAELDAMVMALVTARREAPPGDDLLHRLIAATDDDGAHMDDRSVRDEAVTVFLAGHETTALLLSYALWQLALHPVDCERVLREIDALGRDPTPDDLRSLRQTDAVLRETLRLYPPAWAFGREPLVPIEIGGHTIKPGAQIIVSPYIVQRDARFWPEPESFRPERWLQPASHPRFAWFPFGGGPRVCVGNHFAMMEATLVLATLLRARRPEAITGATPTLVPSITLRPRDGLHLTLSAR